MPGISRKNVDSAGGLAISGSSNVRVNGAGVVRIGDTIQGHGVGLHGKPPVMISGSLTVKANGIGVCRAGDTAECGHTISGSSNVNAG